MTSTTAGQVAVLPEGSLTVSVTGFRPRLLQRKLREAAPLIRRDVMLQLSVLPASIMAAVTVTLPDALR